MRLEDQVVSLDLAKRLKELGVEQGSSNAWCRNANFGFRLIPHGIGLTLEQYVQAEKYSAFTVAELLDLLPPTIQTENDTTVWVTLEKMSGEMIGNYLAGYGDSGEFYHPTECTDFNPANALARLMVWLIESKLIPSSEGAR